MSQPSLLTFVRNRARSFSNAMLALVTNHGVDVVVVEIPNLSSVLHAFLHSLSNPLFQHHLLVARKVPLVITNAT